MGYFFDSILGFPPTTESEVLRCLPAVMLQFSPAEMGIDRFYSQQLILNASDALIIYEIK